MPVTYADIIALPLTEEDILQAINKAKQTHFLDNLRNRHPNVQFDSKIRGYIGEIALKNWFAQYGIHFQQTNFIADETGIDIDLLYTQGNQLLNLELKTSLIPDEWRILQNCLVKGDIKLIRRQRQTIEQLRGDLHLQIYFRQRRKAKDVWLSRQLVDLKTSTEKILYDRLLGRAYLENIFFVGWIDKQTLIHQLAALPPDQCLWQFAGSRRKLWKCRIASHAKKPVELIHYLKSASQAEQSVS